jgi:hypothetical protein
VWPWVSTPRIEKTHFPLSPSNGIPLFLPFQFGSCGSLRDAFPSLLQLLTLHFVLVQRKTKLRVEARVVISELMNIY